MALVRSIADQSRPRRSTPAGGQPPGLLPAFEAWCSHQRQSGRFRYASSEAVYSAMWHALAVWCLAQPRPLRLRDLDAAALTAYIASRDGMAGPGQALTLRYQWRLLSLVRRVQAHAAQRVAAAGGAGLPALPDSAAAAAFDAAQRGAGAAADLIAGQPALRRANAADADSLPAHLHAGEAARLVRFLGGRGDARPAAAVPARSAGSAGSADPAAAPGTPAPVERWQALRNRCAAALQLGAGLGPGDVRGLRLGDVIIAAGGDPAELRVPASGSAPAHVTPLAPWAGRLLARWLQLRSDQDLGGSWLFPSTRSGKPWGKVAQYQAAKQVLADAGLPDEAGGSFRLRHTFALRQLRRGHPPELVARWLGVIDPGVMQRYQRVLGPPADSADAQTTAAAGPASSAPAAAASTGPTAAEAADSRPDAAAPRRPPARPV